jgi:two-component system, sensor histidine kinase PdtaS
MRKCIFLLFYLSFQTLFAQKTPLDSLEQRFSLEKNDATRLELLSQMTGIAFNIDFKIALKYAKRGVVLAEQTGDKNWQPKFYEMQGRMHANLAQLDSAMLFFEKATTGYTAVGNKKGLATTAFKIAWVHKRRNNIEQAMAADLRALRMMEELGDQEGIANALGRVSDDLSRQGRKAEALQYAQRAIDICEKNGLENELSFALRYAGDACIGMGDNNNALAYYNQALELTRRNDPSPHSIADIINSRGNALKRLGRYQEAIADYKVCLENSEKANYPGGISTATANLGESNLVENYGHVSTIYERLGDYKTALAYQKKARHLRDSTASVESDAAISTLRTQYETEQKEATIAAQAAQISQQRTVQWLGFGVTGLLALLAFSLWRSYRNRSRANALLATTNQQLAAKNAENELLLKEIHHRVKNNLQTISSLLNLQSASIEDPNALEAVRESQSRVRSMALIHQKLYQGENLAAVNMKEYFEAMGEAMLHSFGEVGSRVALRVPMNDLELDVDTAIPLGLIASELVTNSLKYAFPKGQNGQIEITLQSETNQQFCLRVSDNGVGNTQFTSVQGTGFGSRLVQLLALQLNGNVETHSEAGMATVVRFSPLAKAA